ncbi:MAG: radical SAM protein [Promethearchaeota archaeon]
MTDLESSDPLIKTELDPNIFYGFTRSICPNCKKTIDAQILIRDNRVIMKKYCSTHGHYEVLLSSDFDHYRYSERFNKPGVKKLEYQTQVEKGCPVDCGVCPEHKQHTCLGILEITSRCNLKCPICFAESGGKAGVDLPFEVVERMIETLRRSEEQVEIIQLSGGEPTLHQDLIAIIQKCKEADVAQIMINTNGRKFAQSLEFCKKVRDAGTTSIYLQFDGFQESTYEKLRGNPNLLKEKLQAIDNLTHVGFPLTLVMTVVEGVNDQEIGSIIRFMHETKRLTGLTLQPVMAAGRHNLEYDPMNHITIPDVIKLIEEQTAQTNHAYIKSDFFPIPCPYPLCSSCCFSYIDPDSLEFTTIKRLVELEDYLEFFSNKTLPTNAEEAIIDALNELFSMATTPGSNKLIENYCQACGIDMNLTSIQDTIQEYLDHVKMIMIKPFQSAWDLDIKRLMKCCIHEVLPDGKIMPFCAYNAIYREKYNLEDYIAQK